MTQKLLGLQKNSRNCINNYTKIEFISPSAPHLGGVHELIVKSAKKALFSILHKADITYEELVTATAGAEDLINSRPLVYQTSHPNH